MKKDDGSKLLLQILSGVIAIILWFAITYTEDPIITQSLSGIELIFDGEDTLESNGLIVTNKDSLPDISAVIRGNRSSVISSVGSITAVADISGITSTGKSVIPIKYNYPLNGITLVKSKVQEITLETEKLVSRNVPIQIITENQDKNSAFMVEAYSSAETIRIRGAESRVYKIACAQAVVDVSGITRSGSQECIYKFVDNEGNEVPGTNIIHKSSNTVTVDTEVYRKLNVPVEVVLDKTLADKYELSVKNQSVQSVDIGVKGESEPEKLEAVITSDAPSGEEELRLTVPSGIYITEKNRTLTVSYQLLPKLMQEFEVNVDVKNLPEGKKAVLSPQKITVTLKGAEGSMSADKIKAEIDAAELMDGESTVPVSVSAENGAEIIGSYSINIEITDK